MQATPIPSVPLKPVPGEVGKAKPVIKTKPRVSVSELDEVEQPESNLLTDLTTVDRLFVTKRIHVKNLLLMRRKKSSFFVRTPDQTLIYTVKEETSWWVGYPCYGLRPLQLHVMNNQGAEVIRINRPYACTARVLPCQLQKLEIYSPPGHLIGSVQQQWTALKPLYLVLNESGDPVFWIRGPYVTLSIFRDVQFQFQRTDGAHVGATNKRWQGLSRALFFAPVTDRFGVAFDRSLNVEEKALLLAVSLLMDYMYYDL